MASSTASLMCSMLRHVGLTTMPTIILATTNPHKVTELRSILADARLSGLEVIGLQDIPGPLREPAETGDSFERNATIKAVEYARQTQRACLADDSGLVIDALAGRPGVISSHYSTDGLETGLSRAERDRLNNQRVLGELRGVPWEQRTARFVCTHVLALPSRRGGFDNPRVACVTQGTFEGRIGLPGDGSRDVPRGSNGFGYDPLFLVGPEFRETAAELEPEVKNRQSHRAAAARRMAEELRVLLTSGELT